LGVIFREDKIKEWLKYYVFYFILFDQIFRN